jgi:creatinine amidohydrolase
VVLPEGKAKTVWLNEMSWMMEAYLKKSDVVLVPIGSTGSTDSALPLLDTSWPLQWSKMRPGRPGPSAHPIWFGDSTHHLAFPGTVSIRTEILAEYVKDVLRSLARHGFKRS